MLKTMKTVFLTLAFLALFAPLGRADESALRISFLGPLTLSPGQSSPALVTMVVGTVSGEITYSLTDRLNNTVFYTDTVSNAVPGQEIAWSVPYSDTGLYNGLTVKQMRASFVMDGKTYTYNLYYNLSGGQLTVEKATWYSNNTACSFGPAFRDVRPGLTDKWYLFTPVDLSRQGRQEFEYIASNLYIIGRVYVDVNGDSVQVTYKNFYAEQSGNTQTLTEFFTFFHDLDSVQQVEPEAMDTLGYRFGETVSIQRDLEGDSQVLLYIRNQVTYCDYVNNTHKLTRFWPNLKERVELRDEMRSRMRN